MANEDLQIHLSMELDFTGLDKAIEVSTNEVFEDFLADEILDLRNNLESSAMNALSEIADTARSLQEQFIGMNGSIHTGTLLNSISVSGGGLDYTIGTSIEHFYPTVIETGRGEVRPVNAKVLHWVTQSGNEVFSMYSSPTTPKPFSQPAYEALDSIIDDKFNNLTI